MANYKNAKANLVPHNENLCGSKYKTSDILEEIKEIDVHDYKAILQYLMVQPTSKIKFITTNVADAPIFIKSVASAMLNDCKQGRTNTINEILNRVLGLPKVIQETTIESNMPQVNVLLENNVDAENLNLLINGNNKDV